MTPRPQPLPSPGTRAALLVIAWVFLQPRQAWAENSVSYKYADYREDGDRVAVRSHYGLVEQQFGTDTRVRLLGVIDAIAGATPTGQPAATPDGPVPLTHVEDRRKAWSVDASRQFPRVNLAVGYANSREEDYVSHGWSVNTLTDFNRKNTTLLLGAAGTEDEIRVLYQRDWTRKHTFDFIGGITQLLDPLTSVTANVGYGRSTGYHADPYRVIQQVTEIVPGVFLPLTYGENRPHERDKWTLYTAVNRSVPAARGAVEASYRLFHDSFGTTAHTVELGWFQKLGEHVTLRPGVRLYQQSAADFYRVDLNGANFTPTGRPVPEGPFFSSDYRLSSLRSLTYGIKAVFSPGPAWQIDAAIERYLMRGRDDVTSRQAYPEATLLTLGARFSW